MATSSGAETLKSFIEKFCKEIEEYEASVKVLPPIPVEEQNSKLEQTISDEKQEMRNNMCSVDQEGDYLQKAESDISESSLIINTTLGQAAHVQSIATNDNENSVVTTNTGADVAGNKEVLSYFVVNGNGMPMEFADANNLDGPNQNIYYSIGSNDEVITPNGSYDLIVPENVNNADNESMQYDCDYNMESAPHSNTYPEDSKSEQELKTTDALNNDNSHVGSKSYVCKVCNKSFATSGEVLRHIRYRHTSEKRHKCDMCDYSCVEIFKLKLHKRCHTGERPYECPSCSYAARDSGKLKRHMLIHTGEKPFECDICHTRFRQSNDLKVHRNTHNVGSKPVFCCDLCPVTCGRKSDLRLHKQNIHKSDSPFICNRCGKELPDRYNYKIHVQSHIGEKCFKCKRCPYTSTSVRHMEMHMLMHTGEKLFVCEECKVAFRQPQLLKRHMNLHHFPGYVSPSGRQSYVCPHCHSSFAYKGNLVRHKKTHNPDLKLLSEKLDIKMGRMKPVDAAESSLQIDSQQVKVKSLSIENGIENEGIEVALEEEYELLEVIDEAEEESEKSALSKSNATVQKEESVTQQSDERSTFPIQYGTEIVKFTDVKESGQAYLVLEVMPWNGIEKNDINDTTMDI